MYFAWIMDLFSIFISLISIQMREKNSAISVHVLLCVCVCVSIYFLNQGSQYSKQRWLLRIIWLFSLYLRILFKQLIHSSSSILTIEVCEENSKRNKIISLYIIFTEGYNALKTEKEQLTENIRKSVALFFTQC